MGGVVLRRTRPRILTYSIRTSLKCLLWLALLGYLGGGGNECFLGRYLCSRIEDQVCIYPCETREFETFPVTLSCATLWKHSGLLTMLCANQGNRFT